GALRPCSKLFTVTQAGAATEVGWHGVNVGNQQLAYSDLQFDVNGDLYSLGSISPSAGGLYKVLPSTGQATAAVGASFLVGVDGGLALAPPEPVPVPPTFTKPVIDLAQKWHWPPPWPPWPIAWSTPFLVLGLAAIILLSAFWTRKKKRPKT